MVAAKATWASELVTVATSNNRQWWHCQLRWVQLKLLPIAMDVINAFIARCQSSHERSPSNATRKAVAIDLEATWRPCQQTQQGHYEGVVSIIMILIPQWQILPQGCQSPQSVHDERKLQCFANQCRSQGSYAWCNDGTYCHCQHGQCKQHKLRDNGGCRGNKRNNKKSLPKHKDKGFKPQCLQCELANHLYNKCWPNLWNQKHDQQQQAEATKKRGKTKPQWHVHYTSCTQWLLDKQQIK